MNDRMLLATGTSLANGVFDLTAPWDAVSGAFTHILLDLARGSQSLSQLLTYLENI